MDLCGHATLASAFVIDEDRVAFDTKSGELVVKKDGDLLVMDFPSRPPKPVTPETGAAEAIGGKPTEILAARDYFFVYETEEEVLSLQPDMSALQKLKQGTFIVTAKGKNCDFVSRFFAPKLGVPEDPVTGRLTARSFPTGRRSSERHVACRQVSARGGDLYCKINGNRVEMAGHAVLYLKGKITLS
jgi:predicted PhzF superfamily epimerase YddE/YHI9